MEENNNEVFMTPSSLQLLLAIRRTLALPALFFSMMILRAEATLWWDADSSFAWGRFRTQSGQDFAENWNLDESGGGAIEDPLMSSINNANDLVFNVLGLDANQTINLSTVNFPAPQDSSTNEYYRRAASLRFMSTGSTTIQSGAFATELRIGSGGFGGITVEENAGPVNLNMPIQLNASQEWRSRTGSNLAIGGSINLQAYNLTVIGEGTSNLLGEISGTGQLIKKGRGTLSLATVAHTYTGGTAVNGGRLYVNGSIIGDVALSQGGTLSGSGTINGNVINAGRVAPGNSPGILTFDGDYTQTTDGTLEIEFGGLTPGPTGHDKLIVGGTANLDGRLEVLLVDLGNGYQPTVGDTITFLTAGTRNGSFASPVAPNLAQYNATHDPDIAFQAAYVGNNVELRVVERSLDGIEFDSVFEDSLWSADTTWTGPNLPDSSHVIELSNLFGATEQTVVVDVVNAEVNQLTIADTIDPDTVNPITVHVQNGKTLTSQTDILVSSHGTVLLEDTGILNSATLTLSNDAFLGGTGTVKAEDVVVNSGTISPGFSVGHLDIDGNVELSENAEVFMEIEGITQFDTIAITGDASLGGTLTVTIPNDGSIEAGDSFEIITAGDTMGTKFDEVLTEGNDDLNIFPIYESDRVSAFAADEGDVNPFIPGLGDDDIAAFALALTNPQGYKREFGISAIEVADFNDNHYCDVDDIPRFAELMQISVPQLTYQIQLALAVPEPTSAWLFLLGCFSLSNFTRSRR